MRFNKWPMVALALCLLAAGTAMAQSSRGGIQGTVETENAERLQGVMITLSSPVLQGIRNTQTDENGKFRFLLLPPGTYLAEFILDGFQTVEREMLQVTLEKVVTLEVVMTSVFTDAVMVTGESPVIDVTSTAIGTQFDQRLLADLPAGRDFTSVTFLATGAVDGGAIADDRLQGNPSIMGASALENRYVVDELDTTDAAEGRAGTSISFNFIEEIQVKTGGYEAEYGGALGGVVNMITKSGGNSLNGDVFVNFASDSTWANALVPETRGDVKTVDEHSDYGFTLGGKIIQDKLWYFVAYNPNKLDQNVFNQVFDVDGNPVQSNTLLRQYERDYFTGKLTWQVNPSNSVTASVLGDPSTVSGDFYSSNFFDSPFVPETDLGYDRKIGGTNLGLNWNKLLSDDMILEARWGHHENKEEYIPTLDATNYQDQTSDGRWTENAGGSVYFGGSGFQQPLDDRTRDQLRAAFTWFAGDKHEIKVGLGLNDVEFDMDYNVAGPSPSFCVPTIEGGAYAYDFETGDAVVIANNCSVSGDGVLNGLTMPARVGNRFRLRDSYYYNRNYKNRSTGKTTEQSFYIQDSWQLADNFTLQLGLRAESSESEGDMTQTNPERKLDFGFEDMLAPRVGFIWDATDDGRSKVFGHFGRFYQSIPLTINVRSFGIETYDFYYYEYPDSGLPSTDNPGNLTYIYNYGSFFTFLDPDVKPQYLEEYVLGGEYEVANNLAVGAKYIQRDLGRVIEDISVDGGNSYFITNPGGTFTVNPTNGVTLDEPVDFPTAERTFTGVELSLTKRQSNNWQMRASLLWSELEGNYEGLYSRDNRQIDPNITSKFDLPELLDNGMGLLQNDREYQFKVFGSYNFDFGLTTGFNAFFLTGNPISKLGAHRTYGPDERFVTPRGSEGRTEDWQNLDLHFSYPFGVGGGDYELTLMADIFNVFNEQVAVEVDQRWTLADPGDPDPSSQTNATWGEPLVYSNPRNIRFGLRFSF